MRPQDFLRAVGTLNENEKLIRFREDISRPIAHALDRVGISPTLLNFVGLFLGLLSGYVAGAGNFPWAATIFFLSILADALDGPLARYLGVVSNLGSFFDSVFDRYADIAILSGLVWYYFAQSDSISCFMALATLMGASITSYAKARAESLGVKKRYVGFMNRPERVVAILLGLCFPQTLSFILFALAILTNITAVQRIVFYVVQLKDN